MGRNWHFQYDRFKNYLYILLNQFLSIKHQSLAFALSETIILKLLLLFLSTISWYGVACTPNKNQTK